MRSRTLLAVSGALALSAVAAPAATAAVPGTAPVKATGATPAGTPTTRSISVTVALKPRAGLDALLERQASGAAKPITTRRFNARFAPSAATVRSVRADALPTRA